MIYIQSNSEKSFPHHFDAACALFGAKESGLDFRLTSMEEIQSGKFDLLLRKNPAIGSADFMEEVFNRIGKKPALPEFSDRQYEITQLSVLRNRILAGEKLFVKPTKHKLFSGFVATKETINTISKFDDTVEVIVYTPFEKPLISEWRIYISNGRMMDGRNYSGGFKVSPDYQKLEAKLSGLKNFPCAFVADIGIMSDNSNVIVEFNDMWAIGNYGIENGLYLELLMNRYMEIVAN